MIGAHYDLPRIVDHQVPLQPDRPLQRVDEVFVLVLDRGNSATGFEFCIGAIPSLAADVLQKITQRTITCHAGRLSEQDLSHIDRNILVRVNILSQRADLGTQSLLLIHIAAVNASASSSSITVKLNVSQVGFHPVDRLQRFQSRFPVARHAEIVGVNVNRMRKPDLIGGSCNRLNNLAGSDSETVDNLIQIARVAVTRLFEKLNSARVNELGCKGTGFVHQPTQKRLQPRVIALGHTVHHKMVIANKCKETSVHIGNRVKLAVHMPSRQGRNRGIKTSRVSQTGVLITGGKNAGHAGK